MIQTFIVKNNFQLEALEKLLPAGFKKQREFFFMIREPNILVLYRKFEANGQDEFFLALTHTFFSSIKNTSGKYLLPPLLEHYPVSIAADQLRTQYSKHLSIHTFDCDLHHLARSLSSANVIPRNSTNTVTSFIKSIFGRKTTVEKGNPVEIALEDGMRLLGEFSPALSYQILLTYQQQNNHVINKQIEECRAYLTDSK